MDLLVLAAAFALILIGAELFTNGIEWAGRRLDLGEGAVGSVLAAVGTALPETMIPLVAIILGGASASAHGADAEGIGVGAVLGAPFMLATLAMFVTGVAVMLRARHRIDGDLMPVNTAILWRDVRAFGLSYALAVAAAFLPADLAWARIGIAMLLVVLYARYVKAHLDAERIEEESELAPLRFRRLERRPHARGPRLRVIGIQVLASLAAIIAGAVVFVDAVSSIARTAGIDPTIMALVVAPVATELPEKFNSVIWIRHGKDTLAMGNITGAMVFQSCIPTGIAIVLAADSWAVSPGTAVAFASAGIAFVSTAAIFAPMAIRARLTGRVLLTGGVFYAVYLAIVVLAIAGGG